MTEATYLFYRMFHRIIQFLNSFIKILQFSINYPEQVQIMLTSHFNKGKMTTIEIVTYHNQEMKMLYASKLPKFTYLSTY